jgi:hypothetical protein
MNWKWISYSLTLKKRLINFIKKQKMDLEQIDHEIKKVVRAAYNVESTKMKVAETLTVQILIPGEHISFEDLISDLCYNEAFMHGLVMVNDPAITETKQFGRDYTKIFLVMVRMQDIPTYIKNCKP